jgi:hypothetical protein
MQLASSNAPEAWRAWVKTGRRRALMSTRSLEYRSKVVQLPVDKDGGGDRSGHSRPLQG